MEWIATYLWELFIFVEVIFWLLIILFLILRYILQWKSASIGILPLFVATIIADLFLGWVDYQQTGEFSLFQIIVVIFVIYAVTSGRSDFQRLDAWVQRKIAAWKGEPEPELTVKPVPKFGKEHAKHERRGWYSHAISFVVILIMFYFVSGPHALFEWTDLFNPEFYQMWWTEEAHGLFAEETINQIVKVWLIILVIDGIISFSYTVSPRKEKTS